MPVLLESWLARDATSPFQERFGGKVMFVTPLPARESDESSSGYL